MKKIESFKSFTQVQAQLREEARLKVAASKREGTVSEFNKLLQKYNVASIAELNEEDKEAFMIELMSEGNAFGAARAEAIAKGEKTFKVGDEEMPVQNVDKEDEENAKEFANEGNAFGAARAEAIAKGEKTFKVGDEEMPVKNVDKEDEENAEEFAGESVVTENCDMCGANPCECEVKEGNAFGAARAKAIAKGEKTFKVGDEEFDVESVDKEDKENAEEFANEALTSSAFSRMEGVVSRKDRNIFIEVWRRMAEDLLDDGFEISDVMKYFDFLMRTNGQGLDEGRAFASAARKAKDEGLEEFEFNGKKYPVLIKEAALYEGKVDKNRVVRMWPKVMDKVGSVDLAVIAKIYFDAMEDANFHTEKGTAKAIGAASKVRDNKVAGFGSDLASAAGWDGYAIANGTVEYLRSIDQITAADKLVKAISKFDLNESVNLDSLEQIIEEGTRGQFGIIDKKGNIRSVYTHYDSYPDNMIPTIKKHFKNGQGVEDVLAKGDNSGLYVNKDNWKFYGDNEPNTTGNVKDIIDYLETARRNTGAEFVYLWDEKSKKWMMADLYDAMELKPLF